MNQAQGSRFHFVAPIFAIAFLAGAMHWTAPSRTQAQEPAAAVSVSPFHYYPAQFASEAADAGEALPTF